MLNPNTNLNINPVTRVLDAMRAVSLVGIGLYAITLAAHWFSAIARWLILYIVLGLIALVTSWPIPVELSALALALAPLAISLLAPGRRTGAHGSSPQTSTPSVSGRVPRSHEHSNTAPSHMSARSATCASPAPPTPTPSPASQSYAPNPTPPSSNDPEHNPHKDNTRELPHTTTGPLRGTPKDRGGPHTTRRRASRRSRRTTARTPTTATGTGAGGGADAQRRRARAPPRRHTPLGLQAPPPTRRIPHRRRAEGAMAVRSPRGDRGAGFEHTGRRRSRHRPA